MSTRVLSKGCRLVTVRGTSAAVSGVCQGTNKRKAKTHYMLMTFCFKLHLRALGGGEDDSAVARAVTVVKSAIAVDGAVARAGAGAGAAYADEKAVDDCT
jgi:hypothetical protein